MLFLAVPQSNNRQDLKNVMILDYDIKMEHKASFVFVNKLPNERSFLQIRREQCRNDNISKAPFLNNVPSTRTHWLPCVQSA